MFIPYSEIMEPFEAWYDEETKSSRVDYYGGINRVLFFEFLLLSQLFYIGFIHCAGMVKTYQLEKKGEYGRMLKVAPVTTETSLNVKTCLALNGTENLRISLQSVVPDISNYKVSYLRSTSFLIRQSS